MRRGGIAVSLAAAILSHSALALKPFPLQFLSPMSRAALSRSRHHTRRYKRSFATLTRENSTVSWSTTSSSGAVKIYCDLDGVLADFDAGVLEICGRPPHEIPLQEMWRTLARTPRFFEQLQWMPGAEELWEVIKPYNPTILTGLPRGNWAAPQKRAWCRAALGEQVPVITCSSAKKHIHCTSQSILIDDRKSIIAQWEAAGGIAIHHLDVKSSIDRIHAILACSTYSDKHTYTGIKRRSTICATADGRKAN